MKVWVCRDKIGSAVYVLFREITVNLRLMEGRWVSNNDGLYLIGDFCPDLFREFAIPRHLRRGTKRLMEWHFPLRED